MMEEDKLHNANSNFWMNQEDQEDSALVAERQKKERRGQGLPNECTGGKSVETFVRLCFSKTSPDISITATRRSAPQI